MAKKPGRIFSSQDKELNELKSAIGSLNTSTQNLQTNLDDLSSIIKNDLVKSISGLSNETKTNTNTKKKSSSRGGGKKEEFSYKSQLTKMFDGMGGDISKNIKKVFGDKKIDNAIKKFADNLNAVKPQKALSEKQIAAGFGGKTAKANLAAGKGPGGGSPFKAIGKGGLGGLAKAGGTLLRGAAGLMRAAGPIGAAFSIGMQVVDFFDSGKAAQMASDVATFFGGAGAGKDTTKALYQNSKAYRDIVADYNIVEPVRQEYAQRRDMMEFQKQSETDVLGLAQDRVKDEYNRRFDNEADWLNFAHSQAIANIDAEHARRKTLFMAGMQSFEKYIGVGERALNAIGSSTEAVLSTITSVGKNLGASLKNMIGMSTAAQGVSKLLGASAEDVLNMGNTFRLMNKTSLEVGTNLVAGIKEFAQGNGAMASVVMKDMVDSSAEIYKFSDGTAENFAKQAIQLNKMGTSMSAMMKASDSMVLNYKDSIKAEMSLSAMLGRNVDLSETRAKLMSGDQAGAAESLRNSLGGQDVGSMNAFQKQQLSQATGMDIEQLMSLQQGGEGNTKGTLDEKNAKKTGSDIANGALKQDIANEAAKVAMEQAMREKMLKFEQEKRKGMLFIEQSQRLENLGIEAKWRLKYAALDSEEKIDMAVAEMQKESASKLINNVFQDSAQTFKDNLTKQGLTPDSQAFKDAMASFTGNQDQIKQYTMGLVQQGILTSENAGMSMADIAQKIGTGQTVTTDFVNQSLMNNNAFFNAEKKSQEDKAALQAKMDALAAERAEKEVTGLDYLGESLLAAVTLGYAGTAASTNDEISADFDKRQAELQSQMDALNKNYQSQITTTNAAYDSSTQSLTNALQPVDTGIASLKPVADSTYTATNQMLTNDDERGKIFKKSYDYQAKISNETAKAVYANVAATEALAASMGKPINLDTTGVASAINRLNGVSWTIAQ